MAGQLSADACQLDCRVLDAEQQLKPPRNVGGHEGQQQQQQPHLLGRWPEDGPGVVLAPREIVGANVININEERVFERTTKQTKVLFGKGGDDDDECEI